MSNPRITYADLVTIANSGHDRFVPALTRDETRELVTDIREHFAGAVAALATLERVRAALDRVNRTGDYIAFRGWVTAALVSQPEAPAASLGHPGADQVFRDLQARRSQPEAPKGQAVDPFALEFENMDLEESVQHLERDLAAAKAKIAEQDAHWRRRQENWRASSERTLAAANAKLERVRCIAYESAGIVAEAIRRALEAPAVVKGSGICADGPEAPKGQTDKPHPLWKVLHTCETDLAAANARAEKAEAMSVQARMLLKEDGEMQALLAAANARADAAEREAEGWKSNAEAERQATGRAEAEHEAALASLDLVLGQRNAAQDARDQLAARVEELEKWTLNSEDISRLRANQCTPEERNVLKAIRGVPVKWLEWWRDWSQQGDDRSVNEMAAAVLVNRAAKAKREAT